MKKYVRNIFGAESTKAKNMKGETENSASPEHSKKGSRGQCKNENGDPAESGSKKLKTEASASANQVRKEIRLEASTSADPDREEIRSEASASAITERKEIRSEASAFVNPESEKVSRTEVSASANKEHEEIRTEVPASANSEHQEVKTEASANPGHNGDEREDSASAGPDHNEQEIPTEPSQESRNGGQGGGAPPSPEMERLMLEAALERWDQKHKIQGVISITKTQAVPRGENFLSIVTRLTVEVVLGSGRHATRRFILKEIPEGEITSSICKDSGIFKLETNIYKIVLKEMEYLMAEFGDTDDVLWCQLIKYDPFTTILLEDLTDYGFKNVKRQSCLNYDHGVLAIRNIARFHGMAKVLQGRGIINTNDHPTYSLINHAETVKNFFFKGYEAVSKGIKKYWGNEWADLADKLKLPLKYLQEKMLDIGKLVENRFYVLNHGDCWSNNLMFKYDWNNKPIAVRFLDFQAPHYNSPAIDLTYFLHQSMEPSVRRSRFNDLIKNYHDSLKLTFKKYKYTGPILTFEELMNEMERVSFFGLSMFAIRHAVVTTDLEDALDLERIFVTEGEEGINIDIFKDLALIERMGPDLRYIVDLHASQI